MIRGVTVQLLVRVQTGTDWANNPIYAENYVPVDNVLVGEPSTDDIRSTIEMFGKHLAYTLGIPKGDTHDWTDTKVILPEPFAGTYQTIGYPTAGIEANIPLSWNRKVKVERYAERED